MVVVNSGMLSGLRMKRAPWGLLALVLLLAPVGFAALVAALSGRGDMVEAQGLDPALVANAGQIRVEAKVVDVHGNRGADLGHARVFNQTDSTPPVIDSATDPVVAADGKTLTITFNEAMDGTSVPANDAFTIESTPDGGIETPLALEITNGVSVSGSAVVLKMASGVAHNDTDIKVSYTKPGSNPLQDASGNDLASFTDRAVTNNSKIPRVSVSTDQTDWTPAIAKGNFVFTRSDSRIPSRSAVGVQYSVSGAFAAFNSVEIPPHLISVTQDPTYSGNDSGPTTITVMEGTGYLPAIAPENAVTVDLKVPASGRYVTVSHAQTTLTVTEGKSATHRLQFRAHDGVARPRDNVSIALRSQAGTAVGPVDFLGGIVGVTVQPGDWTASGNEWLASAAVTIETVDDNAYEGNETYTLLLQEVLGVIDKISFDPGTHEATVTIRDDETLGVTNINLASTPTGADDYYDVDDIISINVTFNGSVTVTGTPQFAINMGGQTRQLDYASGTGSDTLVFQYTVVETDPEDRDGISWSANALALNGGSIKFTSTDVAAQVNADLTHSAQGALSGHKVDLKGPRVDSARVDGNMLFLTYNEELFSTVTDTPVFSVKVDGGTASNATITSILKNIVTLMLDMIVTAGQMVTVSYTDPGDTPVRDLAGNAADSFTDKSTTADPEVAVEARFGQSSYTVVEGGTVDFTVRLDKDPERTLLIPIESAGQNGASAEDYSAPTQVVFASGETQKTLTFTATEDPVDDGGERVRLTFGSLPTEVSRGSLAETTVNITDNDDPLAVESVVVVSRSAIGYYHVGDDINIRVAFNGPVAVDTTGGTPRFAFQIAGQTRHATYDALASDPMGLIFSYTVADTDSDDHDGISWLAGVVDKNGGTIKYASPAASQRVDAVLNYPAQLPLPSHKVDVEAPDLLTATAVQNIITLTYGEDLKADAPAVTAYAYAVGGGAVSNPTVVNISGAEVSLTLASDIAPGDSVTLTYTKPGSADNPVTDQGGTEADAFLNRSVDTPPLVDVTVRFARTSYTVAEDSPLSITVHLNKDPERPLLIPITATPEQGASVADYTVPARVSFTKGDTQKIITFTPTDDPVDDESERVLLAFGDLPSDVTQVSPTQTRVIIQDNDAALTISSVEVTSTAPGGYYDVGNMIDITATFTGPLHIDTTGGTPQFTFELAGQTRQAALTSNTGTTTATFSYTVTTGDTDDHDGISWNANAITLNGGTIQYLQDHPAQRVDAVLHHSARSPLPTHKVDTRKPMLESAEFEDDEIFLMYDEDLNTTAPANTAYTYKVDGGSGTNPTNVSISGKTVTLTLGSTLNIGQTVMLSYDAPNANPVQDLSGKTAEEFVDKDVVTVSDIEIRATPGDRRVALEWDRLTDSTLRRYEYRYMNTSDADWNPDWTNISGSNANTTSFTARNLTNGLMYTFQVRPVYIRGGLTEYGRGGKITAAPRGSLTAPTGLKAAGAGTGRIRLSWNNAGDITLTGYQYRYRHTAETAWVQDWTDMPGSTANTTSHTLSNLDRGVPHTFELRTVRGALMGPSARTEGIPFDDRPSIVRDLRAVVDPKTEPEVHLYFRAPKRSGDSDISTFEYRYAQGSQVPNSQSWRDMPSHLVAHRFFFVKDLVEDELYTFEVRAVNQNGKRGPAARTQATPCCHLGGGGGSGGGSPSKPTSSPPGAPASISAESSSPYTRRASVAGGQARTAYVDVTVEWEAAADHGNAVISYVFRMAEGSRVPSSQPWQVAVNDYSEGDDLSLLQRRLKPNTRYAFEVATRSSQGTSAARSVSITTPGFTGPHYTVSAPSSVREGQTLTVTVRRTRAGGGATALVSIVDYYDNKNQNAKTVAVVFGADATSATATLEIVDDGGHHNDRELTLFIGEVTEDTGRRDYNTFSGGRRTVSVPDTTQ